MGWWWSSTPEPQYQDKPPPSQSTSQPPAPPIDPPPSPPDIADDTPPPRALTRNELADAELDALLRDLESTTPSSSSSPPSPSQPLVNTNRTISPTSLYPTTISCRTAFDTAFYCQSLGGQFNNVYRYGSIRNCSEQWSHFWFCMRTNRGVMGEEERKRRVQEHYRARAGKYESGPSSEDIWRVRERRVEGAFEGDLEAVEREEKEEREGREGLDVGVGESG